MNAIAEIINEADAGDTWPEPMELLECGDLSAATRPPVECVMYPYFPRRHVTLFGGHGGVGKTYLALAFAAHLATGTAWAEHDCTKGRVLFVSLEDEPDLLRWRLAMACGAYGLDKVAVSAGIAIMDGTATAATLAVETGNGKTLDNTAAWDYLVKQASAFDTVIVDNASDAFTANVNDPALVRVFLRGMQKMARQSNAACILLAHIDKAGARHGADGNSYIGTAAWHNTVRSRIALIAEKDRPLTLNHEKHNLTSQAEPVVIGRGEHGVPMAVNAAQLQQQAHDEAALSAELDAPEILSLLQAAIDNGEAISPTRKGNFTAWHVLQHFGLPAKYNARKGKQRFWYAVDWLYQHERLVNEEYRNEDYKTKTRIAVLAETEAANG